MPAARRRANVTWARPGLAVRLLVFRFTLPSALHSPTKLYPAFGCIVNLASCQSPTPGPDRDIGDASLAIFPIDRYQDGRESCHAALQAALDAAVRGEQLNANRFERGEPPIEFGIGLHYGTVVYSNISTAGRLEFTVIGKAANEAARIDAQCTELAKTILVSDDFADHLDLTWRSHGQIELRNIGRPIEIFSPLRENWRPG